ncbi:cysteinyl-tRNA synthetase [Gammaproteobacteria bacterium]|nr:cysteinyl-tRNA synthetase [Gammaproteobacteria bacterium]
MLTVFNSLTRRKEVFKPIVENHINMYVCGMTVYDYCHIGHARSMISFDMINRYLRYLDYKVKFVRNITDIDDKIIKRANERNISISVLTQEFIDALHEDSAKLNILTPDHEPRATDSIVGMIAMIQTLIDKNFAYHIENGDVYYRVRKFKGYGKLSNQNIDDLQIGARINANESKEDPLDFVLWKLAKPQEPAWDSPWGSGRPGWHIECSVMSKEILGAHFDIHGGGMDLKFPHHECEIAQSESCHDHPMANYWMHNGFINVDNEKMGKSLGNFFTIREVLQYYPAEVLRFFVLNAHYRSHVNYSNETLDQTHNSLRRLYTALKNKPDNLVDFDPRHPVVMRFKAAMNDDFNSPLAISILFECATHVNKKEDPVFYCILKKLGAVLGILEQDPDDFLKYELISSANTLTPSAIEKLIVERNQARLAKNWVESDRIRDLLKLNNIILEDSSGITTWRR